ncbi:proteinase-activated receptor 3 [Rhinatrema bivittatum]|uniref:proteinase-activated receptor 3 n=1 Tax=Rhinatrema bivittatum TaxID=194408 RepID=UPI001129F993|nr:proteinase-activated receptor 3 [Rhinatrema bivittatum]
MNSLLVLAGLLFLSSLVCQQGYARFSSDPNITRTFKGLPPGDSEALPHHIIEGLPEDAPHDEDKCLLKGSKGAALKVSNTTKAYLTSSLSTRLIPAVYIAVVLIGVPANAITLWMLFFHVGSVCTAILYTNLAISDFLFCLMLPFKIAYHLNGNHWGFGEILCRTMTVVFYGNMYCSILLLMCISISRYLAIVHPFVYRGLPQRTFAVSLSLLVWIIVFLYMLPFTITNQEYRLEDLNISTCHDVHNACETLSHLKFYYFLFLAIFGFLIPLAVVVFCYISIIRTLSTYDQKWFWYVKITILILTIFTICFTPSNILLIVHHVKYYQNNTDDLYFSYTIALCLSSLNSCLDPFLYFLMTKIKDQSNNYRTMLRVSGHAQMQL